MIELVFVRHGQPEWEVSSKMVDEPGLTELGRQHAERVGQALSNLDIDGFYCSSLLRARQTAAPLAKALGREPVICPWYKEWLAEAMEGWNSAQVDAYFRKWNEAPLSKKAFGPDNGESFDQLSERVGNGMDATLRAHGFTWEYDGPWRLWHYNPSSEAAKGNMRLVFVGHTCATNVAMHHIMNITRAPWEAERFHMGWGAICRLIPFYMSGGFIWRLKSVDERAHLQGLANEENVSETLRERQRLGVD